MTAAPTDPAGPTKAASPATAMPTKTVIQRRFADLGAQGRCALMPFLMAGDPSLQTTAEALLALQRGGADLIELGIPYSDPLADGPVIQQAASRALAAGTTPSRVLDLLASLRGQLQIPVVLFTYSNPLLNRGMERFCQEAAAAGAAGLVVPDLPLEEAETLSPLAAAHGLDLVLLVAPTTPTRAPGPHPCQQPRLHLSGQRHRRHGGPHQPGSPRRTPAGPTQSPRWRACGRRFWHFRSRTGGRGAPLGSRWGHRRQCLGAPHG